MYQIIVSDLDGTLLLPDHTLSLLTKKTLKTLTDLGKNFVFATGRNYLDVGQIRDKLGIKAYMITSNGARVHDADGNLMICHNIDQDIAHALASIKFGDKNIITNIYRDNEWYIDKECEEEKDFFQESTFDYQLYHPDSVLTNNISKIFFVSSHPELLNSLEKNIIANWGAHVHVCYSLPGCLEIMANGVSKGTALKEVTQKLGYSLQDCIAFGDGMNDKEMLSMVQKGCIMDNAHQRLKEALAKLEIIGSNAEDAVTHYLRNLYHL